eukprot:495769-Prorocentrum_minimum.AAC.1
MVPVTVTRLPALMTSTSEVVYCSRSCTGPASCSLMLFKGSGSHSIRIFVPSTCPPPPVSRRTPHRAAP